MKLIGRANLFWEDLEDTLVLNLQPLIIDWLEMKVILKKNYLPLTYKSSLLNEWDCLYGILFWRKWRGDWRVGNAYTYPREVESP